MSKKITDAEHEKDEKVLKELLKIPVTEENCIASRKLNVGGNEKDRVMLMIGKPMCWGKNGEGLCRFRILGKNIDISYPVSGADTLQALMEVIPRAGAVIKNKELNLFFDDSPDLGLGEDIRYPWLYGDEAKK